MMGAEAEFIHVPALARKGCRPPDAASIDPAEADMRVGFIGLGQMGAAMAQRLLDRGFQVTVWNRSSASATRLGERGATVAARPSDLLREDIVISMLGDDNACRLVWLAPGLPAQMAAETIHVNMSSVGLGLARELAQAHRDAGSQYVAAPVFGRPGPAAEGQLDIVAAGEAATLARCAPVFEALGRQWFDAGREPHVANVVKIARNFLLGAIVEGLGEAFALARATGLDPRAFHEILTATSLGCPAYANYGRMILEPPAQPTFPLRLGTKDIEIALEAGRLAGVPMPLAQLLLGEHRAAVADGYGDRDWAALANWIGARAGQRLVGSE
jgi:3-hydroxyisobutyrate dehydrogenase-like beta-hydroxyacid dehydrogenase